MPRKLRIFLEAPPGDGLRVAQDHFKQYIKPVLVASGVDWEFVQGRREGDIRSVVAEKIRKQRKGEVLDEDDFIEMQRRQNGIQEFDGTAGDIVIGRHTWKEYVRGIHEGWLGPLEAPTPPPVENPTPSGSTESENKIETLPGITIHSSPTESETPKAETPAEEKDKPVVRPPPVLPYIFPSEYRSVSLPATIPAEFDPTYPIPFPHILGFFNTYTRFRRFLTRRRLADSIGRDTAAIVLSTYRPFSATASIESGESSFIADEASPVSADEGNDPALSIKEEKSEISQALRHEEKDWVKSVFNPPTPKPDETETDSSSTNQVSEPESEKTWMSPLTTDPRIASRMRKAVLSPEDENRVKEIVVREEEIEGNIKGAMRWAWRWGMGTLPKSDEEKAEDMHKRNKMLEESYGD